MREREGGTGTAGQTVDGRLEAAGARWRASQPSPAPLAASLFATDPGPSLRERVGDAFAPGGILGGRALAFAAGAATTAAVAVGLLLAMPTFQPDVAGPGGPATLGPSTGYIATGVASCPLTKPEPPFTPPPAPGADYDLSGDRSWYGSAALWTWLDNEGEIWRDLPRNEDGIGQKTFWWHQGYDARVESVPAIYVTGERLDGPGAFVAGPGTNASFEQGTAMLVGVELPSGGCWELTARYEGLELPIVVWAEEPGS